MSTPPSSLETLTLPNILIVGRPNVGKSRLFNRIVGDRIAIVHDEAGVTRDPITVKTDRFYLTDTGGIFGNLDATPGPIAEAVHEQVQASLPSANLILFVIDGREGCTFVDLEIADLLRKSHKKVVLVANKMDIAFDGTIENWQKLGFGEPIRVSAEHGTGMSNLFAQIQSACHEFFSQLKPLSAQPETQGIKIAFVGRPNVGKSSITNALLEQKRCIVTDIPGTTRDTIDTPFLFKDAEGQTHPFTLMDTAGLRTRTKQDSATEFFSSVRTHDAIQRSDVVFLILNAGQGITKFDRAIAGQIIEAQKPIAIVINKWDLMPEIQKDSTELRKLTPQALKTKIHEFLKESLYELPPFPILFISAQTGYNLSKIPEVAIKIHTRLQSTIGTGLLNRTLTKLIENRPPQAVRGKRFKCFYAVQIGKNPITLRLFCNQSSLLTASYQRYLIENLSQTFGLSGCPILFEYHEKEKFDAHQMRSN